SPAPRWAPRSPGWPGSSASPRGWRPCGSRSSRASTWSPSASRACYCSAWASSTEATAAGDDHAPHHRSPRAARRRGGRPVRRPHEGTTMKTRLTELLGIEHPVMLAGMGGVSYHQLAAAVSNAGGIGTLGAGSMSYDVLVEEIARTAELTDKPFGVDLLTAMPGDMRPAVEAIIEGGARMFVGALGVPTEVIDLCHANDVLVVNMCGKVKHAVRAVEAGCDLVVAQGTEAGGHTGLVATLPLVPQIVDAVGDRVPVVAAGGIFDGRGLAAALSL